MTDSLSATIDKMMAAGLGVGVDAVMKCESVLSGHKNVFVSVSGGADSDVMLDLIERVRVSVPSTKITYGWFNTGLEYDATKRHLDYLEQRYGIEIVRHKAVKPIPSCCREYGEPFINKYVSEQMGRLQRHGFQWEDDPYEVLVERYPRCISAIKWWCNRWTRSSTPGWFDIGRNAMLTEFIISNPPDFPISADCCKYAKKETAKRVNKDLQVDLEVIGVRQAEGGVRKANKAYRDGCFTARDGGVDSYRPLYWFSNADKADYNRIFGIRNSDCYEVWGFTRTGCVGCPFNLTAMMELATARIYEPKLVRAVESVFKRSYAYTQAFHEFRVAQGNQMVLDLRHARR